jgi:hypothetical protein
MKIKEEQLKKIQDQQLELNKLMSNIGLLEAQKHGLLHDIASVNLDIEEFKKELEKEYGQVNINLEDGSYTKIEKEAEKLEAENV